MALICGINFCGWWLFHLRIFCGMTLIFEISGLFLMSRAKLRALVAVKLLPLTNNKWKFKTFSCLFSCLSPISSILVPKRLITPLFCGINFCGCEKLKKVRNKFLRMSDILIYLRKKFLRIGAKFAKINSAKISSAHISFAKNFFP